MLRILEPEVMDTWEETIEYDSMDLLEVNQAFAKSVLSLGLSEGKILDAGTGTARIPILICQQGWRSPIVGIDLAKSMLEVGEQNVIGAGLKGQITLELADVKQLPYADAEFDLVISNSLVHHLPNPLSFFQEVKRVLKSDGALLIRDLIRPETEADRDKLVADLGDGYSDRQKQLFQDSLQAALTVAEVENFIDTAGLLGVNVARSSERHWTAARGAGE
jgi:ubiquinone/menaquinone biosynthesis C-methylase UbiE